MIGLSGLMLVSRLSILFSCWLSTGLKAPEREKNTQSLHEAHSRCLSITGGERIKDQILF